ncbi:MAG TPA: type III secretion system export apparatus subunit SctU [Rhabdochlamydiaceae bacterium]|jgi:type III secretion protein U|nr:type III secretion system export apparatus subunit SctU [Rhabdochlamydiaceae bacterium]
MAEKSEKATPKKLRDSRKKGQVAKSQDFPSVFTFITSIAVVLFTTKYLFEQLGGYIVGTFRSIAGTTDLTNRAGGYLAQCLVIILETSLPIVVITSLVGVLVSFLVVGPVFSSEVLKIDLKRLNPVTNLKNMFKMKTWIELIKSILKIAGAMFLIYSVIYNSVPEIIGTAAIAPIGSAYVFSSFLTKVIIRVGIFFLIVAIFDLAYQRHNFQKEMKMEKFEVKQEFRDTEGDPHMKSRRKQVAQELAYQEGPMAARRARAIITNPIHLAVALEYDEAKEPAPKILTMGQGLVADQIIKIGQQAFVPIMRNVLLAQTLFRKGKIGEYIPEETYEAIAEILQWLKRLEAGEEEPELFK